MPEKFETEIECAQTVVVALNTLSLDGLLKELRKSVDAVFKIKDIFSVQAPAPTAQLMPMPNTTSGEVVKILQPFITAGWLRVITQRGITVECFGSPQQQLAFATELCKLKTIKAVFDGRFVVVAPKDELDNTAFAQLTDDIKRVAANIR